MLLTVFEKYIFLQSLGWGIANSLWQAALLWIIYQCVIMYGKHLSALFKYNLSLVLLFASFTWFVSTTIQNYFAIQNMGTQAAALGWLNVSENFTNSLQWLSVAYFLVLAVHLLLFAKKIKSLFSLQKSDLIKAPVDIRIFTEQKAFHIGIQKKVSIWLYEKAGVPSVIGFFKPMILLPVTALNDLTTAQAEAVILHELAHIRRHDYLVNFIQCCIEMILFFNPFAKLLGNAARKERENCCDDWVLNYQYNKHDYASALLILEQNRMALLQFALAATNGKKTLLNRIKRLFAEEPAVCFNFSQRVKLFSFSFSILAVVVFTLPFAGTKKLTTVKQAAGVSLAKTAVVSLQPGMVSLPQIVVVNDRPQVTKIQKPKAVTAKKQVMPVAEAPVEMEYNTALINEELLKQNIDQQQALAIQTTHTETEVNNIKVYVKIEEEQSGLKDKCTYYVELNKDKGTPQVKPLVILNKKIEEITKAEKAKLIKAAKKNIARKTIEI